MGSVKFDEFVVRPAGANCIVDSGFADDAGNVRVNNGLLEFYNDDGSTRRTVLCHPRVSTGVVQAKVTWENPVAERSRVRPAIEVR